MERVKLSLIAAFAVAIFLLGASPGSLVHGQTRTITEVKTKSAAKGEAPKECIEVFRAFFKYVQKTEPDIVRDEKAQNLWLSQRMRSALAEHVKRSGSPQENPDYPSNQDFLGVWNPPTTFSIVGSRHYDYRNAKNSAADRVAIDVLYEWADKEEPDNDYPGVRNLKTFVFVREDGVWKLDDIYTFSDEYASPGSLRGYFSKGN